MIVYAMVKEAIANDTGFANTLLHVHGGMLILLVARIVSGRSLGTFIPFSTVLVLELLNEGLDRINHGAWRWDDTILDLANTLFWPFVLSLAVWWRPDRNRNGSPMASGSRDGASP